MGAQMKDWTVGEAPRASARIAGALYLIVIVLGIFAELFVRGRLIDFDDGAATTSNILAHEQLYRLGFVAGIIYLACNIPLAVIFYELFNVVNRRLARVVVFFILLGTALEGVSLVFYFAPLNLLSGRGYLATFNAEELNTLVLVSLSLRATTFLTALSFFGFYCIAIGYLIFRSTFLPRILGVLMGIAGLSYLTHSLTTFLVPRFASSLVPYILLPCFVAETSFCLWLLARGVNVRKWEERAGHWRSSAAHAP